MGNEKVIIFGVGYFGLNFFLRMRKQLNIIAFADNNEELIGGKIYDIPIISPHRIKAFDFDKILISPIDYHKEIYNQLISIGVNANQISFDIIEDELKRRTEKKIDSMISECMDEILLCIEAYKKDCFEDRWKNFRLQYDKIKILRFREDTIGESLFRFFAILHDLPYKEDKTLRVFLPAMIGYKRVCNKDLIKFLNQKIYIPQDDDLLFWLYAIKNHSDEMDFSELNRYISRNKAPIYKTDMYQHSLKFSQKEIETAENQMTMMGIEGEFACIAARSANYNMNTLGTEQDYDYRNMEFDDYDKTISFLGKQNIMTVRMGRGEDVIVPKQFLIDYAGKYASDFMDIWLTSNCKFMIANTSGIIALPAMFGVPICMVNATVPSLGWGGNKFTPMDMYIPKKYYSVSLQRYLSLREIIKIDGECLIWGEKYQKAGIKFIDNTPDEIRDTVEEFLARLEGKWLDTKEDIEIYNEYLKIYKEMEMAARNNDKIWTGGPIPYRLSTNYLKNNLYLLN